jgi:acetyltransferase-like isoleucine patch superfamily enzyme
MEMRKFTNKYYFLFKIKLFVKSIMYSRNLNKRICGGKVSSYVLGEANSLIAKDGSFLENLTVRITGSNNNIIIGENVRIYSNCSILIFGNNCTVEIGANTTIRSYSILECGENNTQIKIGNDCMFSNHIHVRTHDSHFIYSNETNIRLNIPKSVEIGNHVWIAAWVTVLKGVRIGSGAVVGVNSLVTHDVDENSVAVGIPAKIVKKDITWERKLR